MSGSKGQLIHKATIMDAQGVALAVQRISYEVIERSGGAQDICLVGILTRGAVLARRMGKIMSDAQNTDIPVGKLDITPFRDDRPQSADVFDKSEIDFDINGKKVVLVDDVLHTGRTVRAAIEAVLSRGRPACIQLAVLLDRGQRELPIRADYIGRNVPTAKSEFIRLQLEPVDKQDIVLICSEDED